MDSLPLISEASVRTCEECRESFLTLVRRGWKSTELKEIQLVIDDFIIRAMNHTESKLGLVSITDHQLLLKTQINITD